MSAVAFDPQDQAACAALQRLAEQAARVGGEVARAHFGNLSDVRFKDDRSEVSEADEAAQAKIIALIRNARPDDAFIAEEELRGEADLPAPSADRLCWVIDPIDGTRNFVRGLSGYCCSVGVMFAGLPLVGAIYDPTFDLMYSATAGGPVAINGRPLPKPGEPGYPAGHPHRLLVAIPSTATNLAAQLAHDCLDRHIVRNIGSAALHLAYVAAGQYDAALAGNCRLWDVVAGAVLVAAAGGRVARPDGSPLFPFDVSRYQKEEVPSLAANAAAWAELVERR